MEKNFVVEAEKAVIKKTKGFEIEGRKVSRIQTENFMKLFNMLSPQGRQLVGSLPLENQLALAESAKLLNPEFDPTKDEKK